MDWVIFLISHVQSLLVIVNDFDIMRIAIPPNETQPPLLVDPNRILSLSIT